MGQCLDSALTTFFTSFWNKLWSSQYSKNYNDKEHAFLHSPFQNKIAINSKNAKSPKGEYILNYSGFSVHSAIFCPPYTYITHVTFLSYKIWINRRNPFCGIFWLLLVYNSSLLFSTYGNFPFQLYTTEVGNLDFRFCWVCWILYAN